eukprot:CAMPEP_0177596772 /NCGR_PEP_ID=MMETSP0419_2-20121207/11315_1 /TAXON_ID=582737 /ORGANISM="Tetraselmis sp., Strain GSL018" /LENGTH=190 /DNA_ID=CAMNT_0019088815 /DNA_START=701 /DNA_END=1273 /DNA_ORIENTATION=-
MVVRELRSELRSRGLSPAGGIDTLRDRLLDALTQDNAETQPDGPGTQAAVGANVNNYQRPDGQNVGNFITDRPSSRVLAHPGGGSQISLSWESDSKPDPCPAPAETCQKPLGPDLEASIPQAQVEVLPKVSGSAENVAPSSVASPAASSEGFSKNNYSRPSGQNIGNFITDRPTSRVLSHPGGVSQIVLG